MLINVTTSVMYIRQYRETSYSVAIVCVGITVSGPATARACASAKVTGPPSLLRT